MNYRNGPNMETGFHFDWEFHCSVDFTENLVVWLKSTNTVWGNDRAGQRNVTKCGTDIRLNLSFQWLTI